MQIPNCVPEYYRALQEREEHEYELRQKRYAHYEESKRRIEEAKKKGYPILYFGGYSECFNCEKNNKIPTEPSVGIFYALLSVRG